VWGSFGTFLPHMETESPHEGKIKIKSSLRARPGVASIRKREGRSRLNEWWGFSPQVTIQTQERYNKTTGADNGEQARTHYRSQDKIQVEKKGGRERSCKGRDGLKQ